MDPEVSPTPKMRLAAVIKASGNVVRIDDAEKVLGLRRQQAVKLLSRWASQGWLRRVGPGAYVPVQIESFGAPHVVEDPWILVPVLFDPAYIGGRTAAEYWDLTEQIFRDIVIYTARRVTRSVVERQGAVFTVHRTKIEKMFGTQTVWRGQTKIAVSNIHRTIVDMLADPSAGGGIQNVEDCFAAYMRRADRNEGLLVNYAERLGNGAVFKRLGFLAERHQAGSSLAAACRKHLTQGNAVLDTAIRCPRLITRWRLWIPEGWIDEDHP